MTIIEITPDLSFCQECGGLNGNHGSPCKEWSLEVAARYNILLGMKSEHERRVSFCSSCNECMSCSRLIYIKAKIKELEESQE